MSTEKVPCLYCQSENAAIVERCLHCGMPMAKKHPENKGNRLKSFRKTFWMIAVFCLLMVIILPR